MNETSSGISAYYHAKMKDIEHRLSWREMQIKQYAPISYKFKKAMLKKDRERVAALFNLSYIQSYKHHLHFSSDEEFHIYLRKFPLHNCFLENNQLQVYFDCMLFEGYTAWFYMDQDGHVRYYTRKGYGLPISLDLLDFIEICFSVNHFEAKSLFLQWSNAMIQDSLYEQTLRLRYEDNLTNFEGLLEKSSVSKSLSPVYEVYRELLTIGASPSYLTITAYESEIFFASSRYLAARLNKTDHTVISRSINYLNAIGLIEKVGIADLSLSMQVAMKKWTKQMGYTNPVTLLKIPSLKQNMSTVLERINIARKMNVTYRNATANAKGRIIEESKVIKLNENTRLRALQLKFEDSLIEKGYVQMQEMIMYFEGLLTKSEIKREWHSLLEVYDCSYVKPSGQMKKAYGLFSNEYVAILK
ncbi:hypothetical protein ABD91_25880 [Lysinibacillus sphaericus]|uniref:hypothetical protein n=1 Tax=Lysinibacillus sphaericus TaxID=1421 RepID=UPI0018CCF7B3|nr:hypothetical protein [Lysinibacillus sphaericus]MBG9694166.1 hypothetical protein [Lysinibacillus sphaericus]